MSSTPIAVCMFDNEVVRGGAEEHMLCLLRGLDRGRFRALLVCPEELLARLRPELPEDVQALALTLQSHRELGRMRVLRDFLRREQVQVLHSHGFRPSLLASPVGCSARVPVRVETPHVREYWRKGWKSSYAIDRMGGRFVDQYIAVSEANHKYLVEEKGLPAKKITIICNGCDIARFDPAHALPADFRRRAGFAESDRLLLVAARLEAQKGHAILLRAMAALKSEFPNLRLVALGEGSLRAELKAQACELGLESSVLMPGHSSDVCDWMSTADVCVLPSFAEGLPLFAIECLAAGRPMVASAVDGTPEIVVDGKTGLTVPPGDVAALTRAIGRLLREPRLAAELGAAGAAWVRQRFTLERQIRETEDLYERLWQVKTGKTHGQQREERDAQALAHD
ncbi:MAG: glycosyltransferase family 4 protein [Candidatus Korobacteraceae bacterium]